MREGPWCVLVDYQNSILLEALQFPFSPHRETKPVARTPLTKGSRVSSTGAPPTRATTSRLLDY